MKYFLSVFLSLLSVLVVAALAVWIFLPSFTWQANDFKSPIPDSLLRTKNDQVTQLSFWLPFVKKSQGAQPLELAVTSDAALLYSIDDEKMIYEKNIDKPLPMASLTKIMTAVVAMGYEKEEDYFVEKENLVGENSMGLTQGEIISKINLLYGLMLVSGNDAAETLASNYPGGRRSFINAMNKKAESLGMKDTHFTNPSGLQGDGDQRSSAYDLLLITKYALDTYPIFKRIVSTYEYHIPYSKNHKEFYLTNETNLLTTFDGVKGVKTGYTPEAGLCLVTYYEKNGIRFIGVLLNSQDRRGEMKQMLEYGLDKITSEKQG